MTESPKRDGWEEHRRQQILQWTRATPAQRLAALEEMIELARSVGARPRDEIGIREGADRAPRPPRSR